MPTLRETQLALIESLFDEGTPGAHALVREDGLSAEQRIGLYRHNLRGNFIDALALTFPVIERLVGTSYFRQLALAFLEAYPSRSGDLHHIGTPFPAFLQERFRDTQYAYFGDVASLEWACEAALRSPFVQPLGAEALRDIDPTQYERLAFELQPSGTLVRSGYPIVTIWRANQPDAASDETVDLSSGADHVLVLRSADGVALHPMPPATFALIEALGRGEALGEALDHALAIDAQLDLTGALRALFEWQAVTGLRVS